MEVLRQASRSGDDYERTYHRFRPLEPPLAPPRELQAKMMQGCYVVDERLVAEAIVKNLGRSARPD